MKSFTGIIAAALTFFSLSAQVNTTADGFYFEKSKGSFTEKELIWKKRADPAVIRLGYWRGDCCGGVPEAEQITASIRNDTVFYNLHTKRIPDCRTETGLCGSLIDFVIDPKKFPDYKKLAFKETVDGEAR